jgi:5-(carboxyamino)imidazole ribonucleotide synthase
MPARDSIAGDHGARSKIDEVRIDGAPVVGMIGGGQLSRMTASAATALGIGFRVLAASPADPAAQVVRDTRFGSHDSVDDVLSFAVGCDVVTFDHEHVPAPVLEALEAAGVPVRPGPGALFHAQDKVHMRRTLTDLGQPCPAWGLVAGPADAVKFADTHDWPIVLKVSRGGYDGRGVWVVRSADEVHEVMARPVPDGVQWLAEQYVPFVRELSAQVARSPHGQAVAYPVVQTTQVDGICAEVIAPAPGLDPDRAIEAQRIALQIAGDLSVVGMLAVEMFDTGTELLVNELAMRPHNSGHWSIEGAVTSQFENHLRAVLDLPLGDPRARAEYAVMVNILGGDADCLTSAYRHVLARDPGLKVHLYGKQVRPGRKLGHVTVLGTNVDDLLARGRHAADYFAGRIDE